MSIESFNSIDHIISILKQHINQSGLIITSENIGIREHSLFCAMQAKQGGHSPSLIAAALLHDIGHTLYFDGDDWGENRADIEHADIGACWLSRWFPSKVTEPVRLHVLAKRYLCTVAPEYLQTLAPGSCQSFHLQGGALSKTELQAFEAEKYMQDALLLRAWDDKNFEGTSQLPDYDEFAEILRCALTER